MTWAFVVFAVVKVAGYSFLASRIPAGLSARVHPVLFGLLRAIVGGAAGVGLLSLLGPGDLGPLPWYATLSIVRLGVWALTLRTLFSPAMSGARLVKWSLIGVAWSYLLDVAALALSLPALATMRMCDGAMAGSGPGPG